MATPATYITKSIQAEDEDEWEYEYSATETEARTLTFTMPSCRRPTNHFYHLNRPTTSLLTCQSEISIKIGMK